MFKLKRITSALIIAILLIIPSVADASSITTISSQQFDAFEIKRMVETGEFNGADVKRETT